MAITLHLYYKGENGKAKQFMEEMEYQARLIKLDFM